jgi:hypothetical protein
MAARQAASGQVAKISGCLRSIGNASLTTAQDRTAATQTAGEQLRYAWLVYITSIMGDRQEKSARQPDGLQAAVHDVQADVAPGWLVSATALNCIAR